VSSVRIYQHVHQSNTRAISNSAYSLPYLTTPGKCDTLPKRSHALVFDQGSECSGQSKARHLHSRFHSLNGVREIDSEDTCCSSQRNGLEKVRSFDIRRCHGCAMPTMPTIRRYDKVRKIRQKLKDRVCNEEHVDVEQRRS
jgi:hypothetical protein